MKKKGMEKKKIIGCLNIKKNNNNNNNNNNKIK